MPSPADFPGPITDLIETGRDFHRRGWSLGTSSNCSIVVSRDPLHTGHGDLTPHLSGYYDTTTGSKRETASYTAIAVDCGLPSHEILFVSDLTDELKAAQNAGMITALALRTGNKPAPPCGHPTLSSLSEITLA